jgi:hypothetical protein
LTALSRIAGTAFCDLQLHNSLVAGLSLGITYKLGLQKRLKKSYQLTDTIIINKINK